LYGFSPINGILDGYICISHWGGTALILDKKLQIFLAVAENASFSQASKKFSLSQSVISFHIDSLETDLGVRLFDRHGRMITLTPDGEFLFEEGKKLALAARKLEDSFADHSEKIARYVRVAGCTLTCAYTLPMALTDFRTEYPNVLFNFSTLTQDDLLEQLVEEELDVGFVGHPTQHHKLTSRECFHDEIILVGKPKHFPEQLTPFQLSDLPLLWINGDRGLDLLLRKQLPEVGALIKNLNIFTEIEDLSAMKNFLRAGLGVAFLPKVTVADELHFRLLKEIPVEGLDLNRKTYMLYRKNKDHREAVSEFIQFVENRCRIDE
jgi:DNA-binding transcriptional LysR family regulator